MVKKLLSILLLAVVLVGLFGGCSSEQEHDVVTFHVSAYGINSVISSLDDEVGQEIYEKFGVEIVFIPQGDLDPTSMLYANDWGELDMVSTYEDAVTKKYIDAGAFINLDDYKDKLTNFYDYHADSISYWRKLDTQNQCLYVWQAGPDQSHMTSAPLDICVRVDVLEALGWPDLETTDDYIAFLKEAKELFPTSYSGKNTIPMITYWADYYGPLLSTYLPRHSGMQHFYKMTGLVDVESNSIVSMIDNPYYIATLKFWNQMYVEGLLDPEAFTTTEEVFNEKFLSGVALTANFATWMVPTVNSAMSEAGHEEMQYIVMPIRLSLAEEDGVNWRYEAYTYLCPDETRGILKSCENPELLIEVINYLATEAMTIRTGWGIEGEDYTLDENGLRQPTDSFLETATATSAEEILRARGIGYLYQQVFPMKLYALDANGQANWYSNSTEFLNAIATPVQQKAYEAYGWSTFMSPFVENDEIEFIPCNISDYQVATTFDSSSDYVVMEERLTEYLNRQIPLIVTAADQETFDMLLNDTTQTAYTLGQQEIIEQYNLNLSQIAE